VLALALLGCSPASPTGGNASGGSGGSSGGNAGGRGGSSSGSGGSSSGTGGSSSSGSGGSSSSGTGGSGGSGAGGSGGSGTGGSGGSGSGGSGSGGSGGSGTGGAGGSAGSAGSGGTGGSAAMGDAGGGDAPATTGSPGCQGVTAKYCSDFENQTAGGAPNGNGDFTSSGAITVDGSKAFSGTKSLHYKPGGKSQIKFTKQFPLNEENGRLMIFVAKTPPNPSHWDIVQSNTASNIWSWGGMYGKFELVVDPPDDGKDSSTPFPDGRWACIQWKFSQGTGGKSEYHVKLDGMEVNQSPVNGHWKASPWRDLMVGFEVFGSAPIEFWIDDLAFGETEIPCPAKP
jgi:hypothetical protein